MVFKQIMNMFTGQEHCGNLYENKTQSIQNASITVDTAKILISSKEASLSIPLQEVEYLDFLTTNTEEPAVTMVTASKKYLFVFRTHLPQSVLNFYGKVIKTIPIVNNWDIKNTTDNVQFKAYNRETETYELLDENASITTGKSKFGVFIRVHNQYKVYRKLDILQNNSEFYIEQNTKSFSWVVSSERAESIYRVVFPSLPSLFAFFASYISADREEEQIEYLEKMEVDNYVEYNEEQEESQEASEEETEEESDDIKRIYQKRKEKKEKITAIPDNIFGGKTKERNSSLAVSEEGAFISRGSSIGLFRNSDNDLEFSGAIKNLSENGNLINPKKMIVTNKESIILSDANAQDTLYKLDLNTEKISDTWKIKNNVKDFFSESKSSQNQNSPLLGISNNSIFRLDPRKKEQEVTKQYATNPKFSSGDANASGHFAIGSDTGDLRLYDNPEKRAKTHLPGLGDPILSMYISPSGKYIICTCKSYLMLVTSEASGASGFKKSLGKEKPVPKKLMVRPEHLHIFNGAINFTNASISTDEHEKFALVSTGEWLIVWDIKRVLLGHVFTYTIKSNSQKIVANTFVPGNTDRIVVAMEDDIQMVPRALLHKPGKTSQKKR
ncbi:hypothetical protein NEFER03_1540 [Nematocida sp. LUAm3]|nr:hypothetical protein NEFER03_1540 [Nematocida sp. LUAm3]KAI5174573.1 hypothetical protein NEFER02_0694 [Nematocida sp. LUAm2]KAI5178021.1 hypothetical protein NEFER01_1203 [Nematocida sp. LUAm1]